MKYLNNVLVKCGTILYVLLIGKKKVVNLFKAATSLLITVLTVPIKTCTFAGFT